jgi:hypothetical protein
MHYYPHLRTIAMNLETLSKFIIDTKALITIASTPISTSMTFSVSHFTIEPNMSHEGNR